MTPVQRRFEIENDRRNFERHIRSFLEGTEAYRSEKWSEVIEKMEETVEKYLTAEEECRFGCERPFDMGWFPDFITSISSLLKRFIDFKGNYSFAFFFKFPDHFTFCLRCKRGCAAKLSNANGEIIDGGLFPLVYHYLQIAYFKSESVPLFGFGA